MQNIGRGFTTPIIWIDGCCFLNKKFIKAKIRRGSKYKTIKSIRVIKGSPLSKNKNGENVFKYMDKKIKY